MLKIYTHNLDRKPEELRGLVQFSRRDGLLSGLDKSGIPYEYQSENLPSPGDRVLVMSDHTMLRKIIDHKRDVGDFTLLTGPILEIEDTHRTGVQSLLSSAISPQVLLSNLDSVFTDSEVDGIVTAGAWAREGWRFACPAIGRKTYEWPAGVDMEFWDGSASPEKGSILLYSKKKPEFTAAVQQWLEQMGYRVNLITYGRYTKEQLREACRISELAVVISQKETQGIALAEMWAMGLPTLCWDEFCYAMNDVALLPVSSCPYLTKDTGWRWRSTDELGAVLKMISRSLFSPRSWVSKNMSDKVSAEILLGVFDYVEFLQRKQRP